MAAVSLPTPDATRGGDIHARGGVVTRHIAPLPLPTGLPPADPDQQLMGKETEAVLEVCGPRVWAFGWEVGIAGIFWLFVMMGILPPVWVAWLSPLYPFDWGAFIAGFNVIGWLSLAIILWLYGIVWYHKSRASYYKQFWHYRPLVFNRQRREVWFTPAGAKQAVVVPWESVCAWVIESTGATQYGVHRHAGMGLGFPHGGGDDCHVLEFQVMHPAFGVHLWEAIRGWMEYEIDSIRTLGNPEARADDPPWEGVHTLHQNRRRLHQQWRAGERGLLYVIGWYVYRVLFFWSVPFHLAEREGRIVYEILEELDIWSGPLKAWCEPLPPEAWAKPSAALRRQSALVTAIRAERGDKPTHWQWPLQEARRRHPEAFAPPAPCAASAVE